MLTVVLMLVFIMPRGQTEMNNLLSIKPDLRIHRSMI